MAKKDLNLRL